MMASPDMNKQPLTLRSYTIFNYLDMICPFQKETNIDENLKLSMNTAVQVSTIKPTQNTNLALHKNQTSPNEFLQSSQLSVPTFWLHIAFTSSLIKAQ